MKALRECSVVASRTMSSWLSNVDVVTLFVEDLARTKTFYQDVFGLSAIFENENSIVFNLDNTSLNFLQRDSAPDLVAPAKLAPPDAGTAFNSRFASTASTKPVRSLRVEA